MKIYNKDGPRIFVKIQEFINLVILSFVCSVERNLLYLSCLKTEGSWRRPGGQLPPDDQFIIRLGHLLSSIRTTCPHYCKLLFSGLFSFLFFSEDFIPHFYLALYIYIYTYIYTV